MAATSGLGAISAHNLAGDLLAHISPASSTTATVVTVTGPLLAKLYTSVIKNDTRGTECADSNYTNQAVSAWNAASTASGSGYNVGVVSRTSNVGLTFGGGSGFAAQQTLTGLALDSSDGTPILVFYNNFAASVVVPAGNQYVILSGNLTIGIS